MIPIKMLMAPSSPRPMLTLPCRPERRLTISAARMYSRDVRTSYAPANVDRTRMIPYDDLEMSLAEERRASPKQELGAGSPSTDEVTAVARTDSLGS